MLDLFGKNGFLKRSDHLLPYHVLLDLIQLHRLRLVKLRLYLDVLHAAVTGETGGFLLLFSPFKNSYLHIKFIS